MLKPDRCLIKGNAVIFLEFIDTIFFFEMYLFKQCSADCTAHKDSFTIKWNGDSNFKSDVQELSYGNILDTTAFAISTPKRPYTIGLYVWEENVLRRSIANIVVNDYCFKKSIFCLPLILILATLQTQFWHKNTIFKLYDKLKEYDN